MALQSLDPQEADLRTCGRSFYPRQDGLSAYRSAGCRHYAAPKRETPLAIDPFRWDDYLKNDALTAALLSIHKESALTGEGAAADAEIAGWDEPMVSALWPAVHRAATSEMVVERNGTLAGPLLPARRIAGLNYKISLPAEWTSKVEPAQFFRADVVDSGNNRVVRIAGSKDTRVFQWDPVAGRGLHHGSITLQGHVSPGAMVIVIVSWLDSHERNVGFRSFRLPDGDWPNPVTLELASLPPLPDNLGRHRFADSESDQVAGDWTGRGIFSCGRNNGRVASAVYRHRFPWTRDSEPESQ